VVWDGKAAGGTLEPGWTKAWGAFARRTKCIAWQVTAPTASAPSFTGGVKMQAFQQGSSAHANHPRTNGEMQKALLHDLCAGT